MATPRLLSVGFMVARRRLESQGNPLPVLVPTSAFIHSLSNHCLIDLLVPLQTGDSAHGIAFTSALKSYPGYVRNVT